MSDDAADATLELTLLSVDGFKPPNFLSKSRQPLAVAWVDPCFKRSTKPPSRSGPTTLHLPLSPLSLRNPRSLLTVQILSPLLPFRAAKPLGTAVLPLASLPSDGQPLSVPLRRPSGRALGSLRFSVRFFWCLGDAPVNEIWVQPTAPPMPEWELEKSRVTVEVGGSNLVSADPSALPMPDAGIVMTHDLEVAGVSEEFKGCNLAPVEQPSAEMRDRSSGWRSFLLGFVSGTFAAVLVVAAEMLED